jgi:hypothetical protein
MNHALIAFSPLNVQDRTQRNVGHLQCFYLVEKKEIGREPAFWCEKMREKESNPTTYGTLRLNSPRILAAFATMEYLWMKMRTRN